MDTDAKTPQETRPMTDQIIILGWDALDIELIENYGLGESFGEHRQKIDTYVNPVIDEPHTKELWPSMITGLHPNGHGIHAVTDTGGVEWENEYLNRLSTLSNGIVPQPVLDAIGKRLRERGAALDQKRRRYYSENELPTIFDRENTVGISIPNRETPYDRKHGLDALRDEVWAELLADRDGAEGLEPNIPIEGVYDVLGREIGQRIGHIYIAQAQGKSLIFVWFGCLDTVGHMAPAVEAPLERDWYHVAAGVTDMVRNNTDENTTVLSVSDHGLQNGDHTHYATLASDDPEPAEQIETVFDVAPYLQSLSLKDMSATTGIDGAAMDSVHDQLEDLGYVE